MFCYQCEQTAKGKGCEVVGVCGKQPEVASLQDLLIFSLKGLSVVAKEARRLGILDNHVNVFTVKALFSTLTNVNFDPDDFVVLIQKTVEIRDALKEKVKSAGGNIENEIEAVSFKLDSSKDGLIAQGQKYNIKSGRNQNDDITSLQDILTYGLKGIAAYADHAQILGKQDESVYEFIYEALASLTDNSIQLDKWLDMVLQCGKINLKAMELLDSANTGAYGNPVPTAVPLGHKKGKAILVSGHDLKDLEELLKQTEGKGVYIYTHGEMLPAHGYPNLKKYQHLYGHYGTAWQNQHKEFAKFPGAILMTTNCIQKPNETYKDSIFTSGIVGWPNVKHIDNGDFTPVIQKALSMDGFTEDSVGDKAVTVGFARNTVLSVADKIIEAVKNKAIRHFFLVAGCDGAKPGRNYYTEFVEKVPKDCVVLTLACGKFRFFDKELGDIGGIPRLLDVGQCNDAYSAIQIAVALSKAFNVSVNELPLSLVLSWYEQKAVAILLTLLYLGIKNIRLGPSLPAFVSPNVLNILVQHFNIMPIKTPDEDLKAILG